MSVPDSLYHSAKLMEHLIAIFMGNISSIAKPSLVTIALLNAIAC